MKDKFFLEKIIKNLIDETDSGKRKRAEYLIQSAVREETRFIDYQVA